MTSHIALITGSTGGIGEQLASQLARDGWNLILLNRSKQKTEDQISTLSLLHPGIQIHPFYTDFFDLDSLKEELNKIVNRFPSIDALFNVAGFLSSKKVISQQNIEAHFAVNVVAPYMIIEYLLPSLANGSWDKRSSFVVNLSSEVILGIKGIEVSSLVEPPHIDGLMGAYAVSKLALNVIAKHKKDKLKQKDVSIFSVDPGPTKSNMTDLGDGMPWFIKLLRPLIFKPASLQVKKMLDSIFLAITEDRSGLFISNGKIKTDNKLAFDKKLQMELESLLQDLIS